MKKTFTTILSLALALILVSSLSSGVILAKGDHEREVVIFDCVQISIVSDIFVRAADSSMGAPMIDVSTDPENLTSCSQTFADLLNLKFKVEDITTSFDFMGTGLLTRYTMIKK